MGAEKIKEERLLERMSDMDTYEWRRERGAARCSRRGDNLAAFKPHHQPEYYF